MSNTATSPITPEVLESYIQDAAKMAGYAQGFGVTGCDLSQPFWWAGYCRQSLDQQSYNNRLPEYLLTLAKMAKEQGVIVPIEYCLYDHLSGEHLDRPSMQFLRRELVGHKKVLGIFFSDLRCLSREPAPQQVFEREAEIRGIRLVFGDAPSGMDVGSQFARSAITFSNKLTRLATHNNARAGSVGRILKGSVPSCRTPYGFTYCRDAEINNGKIWVKKAWWEVDRLDEDGKPVENSPAWIVQLIFRWIGLEGRTTHWVATRLNEMKIPRPRAEYWMWNTVSALVHNHGYTGHHYYNANCMVPNPDRPLGDVTGKVRRTILRPKPREEWVNFTVPQIVSEELWQRANDAQTSRGRGRGKRGKTIQALLRGRIYCPVCAKPMLVRSDSRDHKTVYHCSRRYRASDEGACGFRKFIPPRLEDSVWDAICALLSDDAWLDQQIEVERGSHQASTKLIDAELKKISLLKSKISKVQIGYEEGVYDTKEAKARIQGCQAAMVLAGEELKNLQRQNSEDAASITIETLKRKLDELRQVNLNSASFEEKLNIITLLNVRIYPSDDLKAIRIKMGFGNDQAGGNGAQNECVKVLYAPPKTTKVA